MSQEEKNAMLGELVRDYQEAKTELSSCKEKVKKCQDQFLELSHENALLVSGKDLSLVGTDMVTRPVADWMTKRCFRNQVLVAAA